MPPMISLLLLAIKLTASSHNPFNNQNWAQQADDGMEYGYEDHPFPFNYQEQMADPAFAGYYHHQPIDDFQSASSSYSSEHIASTSQSNGPQSTNFANQIPHTIYSVHSIYSEQPQSMETAEQNHPAGAISAFGDDMNLPDITSDSNAQSSSFANTTPSFANSIPSFEHNRPELINVHWSEIDVEKKCLGVNGLCYHSNAGDGHQEPASPGQQHTDDMLRAPFDNLLDAKLAEHQPEEGQQDLDSSNLLKTLVIVPHTLDYEIKVENTQEHKLHSPNIVNSPEEYDDDNTDLMARSCYTWRNSPMYGHWMCERCLFGELTSNPISKIACSCCGRLINPVCLIDYAKRTIISRIESPSSSADFAMADLILQKVVDEFGPYHLVFSLKTLDINEIKRIKSHCAVLFNLKNAHRQPKVSKANKPGKSKKTPYEELESVFDKITKNWSVDLNQEGYNANLIRTYRSSCNTLTFDTLKAERVGFMAALAKYRSDAIIQYMNARILHFLYNPNIPLGVMMQYLAPYIVGTVDQGNAFVKEYIDEYNKKFTSPEQTYEILLESLVCIDKSPFHTNFFGIMSDYKKTYSDNGEDSKTGITRLLKFISRNMKYCDPFDKEKLASSPLRNIITHISNHYRVEKIKFYDFLKIHELMRDFPNIARTPLFLLQKKYLENNPVDLDDIVNGVKTMGNLHRLSTISWVNQIISIYTRNDIDMRRAYFKKMCTEITNPYMRTLMFACMVEDKIVSNLTFGPSQLAKDDVNSAIHSSVLCCFSFFLARNITRLQIESLEGPKPASDILVYVPIMKKYIDYMASFAEKFKLDLLNNTEAKEEILMLYAFTCYYNALLKDSSLGLESYSVNLPDLGTDARGKSNYVHMIRCLCRRYREIGLGDHRAELEMAIPGTFSFLIGSDVIAADAKAVVIQMMLVELMTIKRELATIHIEFLGQKKPYKAILMKAYIEHCLLSAAHSVSGGINRVYDDESVRREFESRVKECNAAVERGQLDPLLESLESASNTLQDAILHLSEMGYTANKNRGFFDNIIFPFIYNTIILNSTRFVQHDSAQAHEYLRYNEDLLQLVTLQELMGVF